ncbi:MAG: hypothetical protein FGM32_01945 [Candidatus Kapabacteria bacterium]|nr:hypothetical protein [Candidatus Kapabacteria bacterium]
MKNIAWMKVAHALITASVIVTLSGCYGLALPERGMHYQTEKVANLDAMKFRKIGVYALSDGKAQSLNGMQMGQLYMAGIWVFNFVPVPYAGSLVTRSNATDPYGFSPSNFPDKIEIPFKLKTDSSNAGPSFELALAMKKQLEERGFDAEAATDVPHSGHVTSEQMLAHATKSGYDAAFLMTYKLYKRWQRLAGTETTQSFNTRTTIVNVKYNEGYLYIPSVALVDVKTGKILWSSAYYGIVSNAHTPNASNQAFGIVVNEAIIQLGRETYVEAAKSAVENIFKPQYWKGSYKPFPAPKQRKEGEKFDF